METLEDVCGEDPSLVCEWLWEATGNKVLTQAIEWFVHKPLIALVIAFSAFVLRKIVHRTVDRFVVRTIASPPKLVPLDLVQVGYKSKPEGAGAASDDEPAERERRRQRAESLGSVLKGFSTIAIFSVAVLMILGEFNISLAPLLAGAGIAGVALGFGAQTVVRDLLAGMFMLVEDQFGVGDVIDVGEATGVVETVGLRITRLRDVQGTLWHVPNGEIRRVGNLSQLWARTILDVSIARNTDLTHAMEVIRSAAHDLYTTGEGATILEEPEVWGVEEIGPDSISIRLAVKTEPSQQFKVARMLRARLKEAFDENGIEIPFPQRTIWVHNEADREE
jgi:small conductance mechanosensitive channel